MTTAKGIETFGVAMLVATALALFFNVHLLASGRGDPWLTMAVGLLVGVGAFIVGEIRR